MLKERDSISRDKAFGEACRENKIKLTKKDPEKTKAVYIDTNGRRKVLGQKAETMDVVFSESEEVDIALLREGNREIQKNSYGSVSLHSSGIIFRAKRRREKIKSLIKAGVTIGAKATAFMERRGGKRTLLTKKEILEEKEGS